MRLTYSTSTTVVWAGAASSAPISATPTTVPRSVTLVATVTSEPSLMKPWIPSSSVETAPHRAAPSLP